MNTEHLQSIEIYSQLGLLSITSSIIFQIIEFKLISWCISDALLLVCLVRSLMLIYKGLVYWKEVL